MKNTHSLTFGWRHNQDKDYAVIKKKSQADFFISIIIAFLIIFIVSQILGYLDQSLHSPFTDRDLSLLNPLKINSAQAGSEETIKMIQSHREVNIIKGKGFTFTVGFKNLGNSNWKQKGSDRVELKIAPPYTRETIVRHVYWRDSDTPAWLMGDINKPGWIAYYKFALEAPKESGIFTEKFVLVRNDSEIVAGSEFDIIFNVWNSTAEFPKKGQSNKLAKKSTTPQPSQQKEPESQIQSKPDNSEKIAFAQQCINLSTKTLKIAFNISQETIDDCLDIGVDLSKNLWVDPNPVASNSNDSSSGSVVEETNSQEVNDSSSSQTTTLMGPTMRIGLFYTTEPIIIKANSSFQIKDKYNAVLANIPANIAVTTVFLGNTYTVNSSVNNFSTSSYIRFESMNSNIVYEVVSYESRPAWNTSLNDNKFLGDLEIRYAASTNRLWLIDELPMGAYLKGLAESSNSSPLEYQKALVTAARTYAMHHYNRGTKHANENFTLDARYDQVYKGYGSQTRLPKVSQAVEETKGQVVTYQGEIAITPYFSHSDGRTRTWSEVWGGDVSWCIGVEEPAGYTKTTLFGHGVGMSAHGALLLAADHNYTFEEILKYYYTGIEVTKMY